MEKGAHTVSLLLAYCLFANSIYSNGGKSGEAYMRGNKHLPNAVTMGVATIVNPKGTSWFPVYYSVEQ